MDRLLMDEVKVAISEDEAVVLFEFFERFGEREELYFVHPAEYISLMKISAQIDKNITAMFQENYGEILREARNRIAEGFDGDIPQIRDEDESSN